MYESDHIELTRMEPTPLNHVPALSFISRCGRHCSRWCRAMTRTHAVILAALVTLPAPALAQELMPTTASGWTQFAARPDSAPGVASSGGSSGYTLNIYGNGVPNVYGGWRTRVQGLHGGGYYRFRARAVPGDITSPREAVTIILRWRGAFGDEVSPDYVWDYRPQTDGSLLFDRTIQAPSGATAVDVELVLQWASNGRLAFDRLSFTAAAAPAARPVRLAAVYFRPSGTTSGLDSVQRAARHAEQVAATHRPDVMVLGELLNVIGAPGSFDSKAETVPGPSTDVMAGVARAYNVNVVFGILEREGRLLYNTAVLLDRTGAITGKYRKVQVPLSESSAGVGPGSSVPVFDTDVGRVALLICHDTSFPEPAREAALQGAELLLVPIWGGKTALVRARAAEHGMYVVASGYDYASEVVDPLGSVLDAVTTLNQPGAAVADVDLSRRFREMWLGDWRDISNKERRTAPYQRGTSPSPDPEPPPPDPDQTPPAVSLTSPTAGGTVSGSVGITAAASDNVAVASVRFFADGTPLGAEDTAAPYSISWDSTTASNGTHTLTATAIDTAGNSASSSITVNVSNGSAPGTSAPFTGTPASLPGRIQAEDFDDGGQSVAYSDATAGNSGGQYRQTDVDLEVTGDTGGGYNIGYVRAGEWLNYTVTVAAAGTYNIRVRVAAPAAGGTFHIESNGADRTGPITIPNTGAWQAWTTINATASLPAGQQVLRIVADTSGPTGVFGNINWLEVGGSAPFTGAPLALPGRVQAENFDHGGQGLAYADSTAGNSGGQYRQTDVDLEITTDSGGGYDVGWMRPAEWLNYTVTVATAGTYIIRARVAAPAPGGTFHVESQGVDRTGPLIIPNTGGWQNWVTITATASLPAGQQVLRLVADSSGATGTFGNINWLEVAPSSGAGQE
jgi:predicted amidohydrolase